MTAGAAATQTLRRSLSLPLVVLYGMGTTVGAGIYALIGEVAGTAGVHTPLSFVLAGAVAALSGLTFAELSARFPKSAGEAVYVREGLGLSGAPLAVGLLVALAGSVSAATIANGFVGYLGEIAQVAHTPAVLGLHARDLRTREHRSMAPQARACAGRRVDLSPRRPHTWTLLSTHAPRRRVLTSAA